MAHLVEDPRHGYADTVVCKEVLEIANDTFRHRPRRHPRATRPNPGDSPFIALAMFAGCTIVTGNTSHFQPVTGVVVLMPGVFLARVMG